MTSPMPEIITVDADADEVMCDGGGGTALINKTRLSAVIVTVCL